MYSLTKEQLRLAQDTGGVSKVKLRSAGSKFTIQIETANGGKGQLVSSRTKEPRAFSNPANALAFLHDVGITAGEFDTQDWKSESAPSQPRARATAYRSPEYLDTVMKQIQGYESEQAQEDDDDSEAGSRGLSEEECHRHRLQVDVARVLHPEQFR